MISLACILHPTAEEQSQILDIYHQQGWWPKTVTDPLRVHRAIQGSHCYVVARDNARIVGIGRALSDGVGDAYIHDVTVVKSYRHQGIGGRIVSLILECLQKDGITWVGLIAEKGSPSIYKKFGFAPLEGSLPMFRFDTNPK